MLLSIQWLFIPCFSGKNRYEKGFLEFFCHFSIKKHHSLDGCHQIQLSLLFSIFIHWLLIILVIDKGGIESDVKWSILLEVKKKYQRIRKYYNICILWLIHWRYITHNSWFDSLRNNCLTFWKRISNRRMH